MKQSLRGRGYSLLRDYRGYLLLMLYALERAGLMLRPPYSIAFLRQFNACCVQGIGIITLRAGSLGVIVVAYVLTVVGADSRTAMHILVVFVFREGGPLLAALVLLLKVGTENTTQLGKQWASGQANYVEALGVPAYDYLVVPRLLAAIAAAVLMTFHFQLIAAFGAVLCSPLFLDATFEQLLNDFSEQFRISDWAYTLIKSLVFGVIIGTVSCYHGVSAVGETVGNVRHPLSLSLLRTFFFIALCNALFAYLFYGVMLFGLIRSTV